MGLLDDLDRRRETASRHRENSGRLAEAYADFETTGQGTHEYAERINFGLTFVDKPVPSWCCEIDMDALQRLLGPNPALPQATPYVTDWDIDAHEMYTGCWVAARVDFHVTEMIDPSVAVVIRHVFTFSGVALKDVSPELSV